MTDLFRMNFTEFIKFTFHSNIEWLCPCVIRQCETDSVKILFCKIQLKLEIPAIWGVIFFNKTKSSLEKFWSWCSDFERGKKRHRRWRNVGFFKKFCNEFSFILEICRSRPAGTNWAPIPSWACGALQDRTRKLKTDSIGHCDRREERWKLVQEEVIASVEEERPSRTVAARQQNLAGHLEMQPPEDQVLDSAGQRYPPQPIQPVHTGTKLKNPQDHCVPRKGLSNTPEQLLQGTGQGVLLLDKGPGASFIKMSQIYTWPLRSFPTVLTFN